MQRGIRETGSTLHEACSGHNEPVCSEIKLELVTKALAGDGALVFCRFEI
jgi:hypothetical protein